MILIYNLICFLQKKIGYLIKISQLPTANKELNKYVDSANNVAHIIK